jgi:hypothetical protein
MPLPSNARRLMRPLPATESSTGTPCRRFLIAFLLAKWRAAPTFGDIVL